MKKITRLKMAVLQKIRERSGLLVGVIGFCLLAFILGELINGGISLSSRNVGSINGKDISTQDFLNKVNQAQQRGQTSSQVFNQIWNSEVRNILFNEQFEKLGLRLGQDQLMNVIQTLPDFAQNPQFLNEAGMFDQNKFKQFVAGMKTAGSQQWNAWLDYENQIESFAKEQIYYAMIKGAIITTSLEAKVAYRNEVKKVNFDYVTLPYSNIKDEEVKISDKEIEDYIKKHEKQFKSDISRVVDYVFIENKPSKEDQDLVKKDIEDLLEAKVAFNSQTNKNDTIAGFRKTANAIEFVNANSDVPFDSVYYSKEQLPAEHSEALFNLGVGEMYGPYLFNDYYCVSKVVNKKADADKVTASHILIAYKGATSANPNITLTKEEAKAKAESLMKQAQANPATFASLAEANTDDPGSKTTGGQYKDITRGQMVTPFENFIFSKPVGSIGVVETDFGYHVIKVDEKNTEMRVQLATLAKRIDASAATQDQVHALATKFEERINSQDFSKLASDLGLIAHPTATIKAFSDELPGVGTHKEAISWAFNKNTKANDYKRFSTGDGELVIRVKEVNNSGLMSVEEARAQVQPILMNKKKAEILRKKMSGKSLEEIAKAANTGVQRASDVTIANPTVNGFYEPKIVGAALNRKANETSSLIDGRNGVYVIKTIQVVDAPQLPNYEAYKSRVFTNNRNTVNNTVFSALYQNADIEDNRVKLLN